jgi:tetratricopeptide (TPR) repeat protein
LTRPAHEATTKTTTLNCNSSDGTGDGSKASPFLEILSTWWGLSLIITTTTAVALGIAFALPSPAGLVVTGVAVLGFCLALYFNPKYRYQRIGSAVLGSWLAIRSVPDITVLALPVQFPFFGSFKGDVPWTFDLALGAVVVLLFLLDYKVRSDGAKASRYLYRLISSQKVSTTGSNSQNIVFGDVSNNNASVAITIVNNAQRADFNARIDQAAEHLKTRLPDVAIVKLNEIRRESWDCLSDRERYRVEANLGHAYNLKDDWVKAARHFLDARKFQPDDLDAAGLEAIAYYLLGDKYRAKKLAEQVLSENPRNENAIVAKIRSTDESVPTADLAKSIPSELAAEPQIIFALCCAASVRRELEAAVAFSRKLHQILPSDPQSKMSLGCALANLAIDGHVGRSEIGRAKCESMAVEAAALLTNVLGTEGQSRLTRAHALYHRGLAKEVLGKPDQAEADLRAATAERPGDGELDYQLCVFFVRHDKYEQAIEHFESMQGGNTLIDPGLMLSRLLFARGNPDDQDRAEKLLLGILDASPPPCDRLTFEGLEILTRELSKSGYRTRAEELLETYSVRLDTCSNLSIKAEISLIAGDNESARVHALQSYESIGVNTPTVTLYFLGKILADLSETEKATEVLKQVVDSASSDLVGSLLLKTAWQAKDYGFVIDFASKLRELGRATLQSRELEIVALEAINEHADALKRIDEYLESADNQRFARYLRLRKAWIGKWLENESLVTYEATQLPSLEDCEESNPLALSVVCGVAQLLSEGVDPEAGYELAYKIVRKHFDSPEAHQCLLAVCGFGTSRSPVPKLSVDNESAVAISDCRTGEIRWCVIESDNASITRNEIGIESQLAQRLLGKTVGDRVQLNSGPLQERYGVIEEIHDKLSYRVMDSMSSWARRFDDNGFLTQFDFSKPNGELDVDAFFEVQQKLNEPMEAAIFMYRHQFSSIGFLANFTGRSILQTVGYLASARETHIQCCSGTAEERALAVKSIASHKRIVLDPTSLSTLFLLKAHTKIDKLPADVYVTASTLETLRSPRRSRHSWLFSKRYIGFRFGAPRFEERTDEDVAKTVAELSSFIDWVAGNTTIVGGRDILSLPIQAREQWRQIFGTPMVESIGIAVARSAILCTDDPALILAATEHCAVERMWTHLFFEYLCNNGILSCEQYREFLVRLITFDYRFVTLDQEMIDLVGIRSGWSTENSDFSAVIEWLHLSHVASPVPMAAYIIGKTWDSTGLAHLRSDVLSAVIRALGKRSDSITCLRHLHSALRPVFRMQPDALQQCHQAIRREEARELAVSPLILPGDPDFSIPKYFFRRSQRIVR